MNTVGGLHLSEQLERVFLQIGEAQTLDGNGDELVSGDAGGVLLMLVLLDSNWKRGGNTSTLILYCLV